METPNRMSAFLVYFLLIFGCLYVFIFRRQDKFALFHAKQSLLIMLTALITPIIWGAMTWLMAWLPFGFALAIALFSLVVVTYICLALFWLMGIMYVSQFKTKPLPVIGDWAKWIPIP